jgi:hypothetical protein
MPQINTTIKRGFFDNLKRSLIINKDFFEFRDKNLLNASPTRFNKNEISDFRFGVRWILGYAFYFGREYQVFIRNLNNEVVKVSFTSFYGVRQKKLNTLYSDIINSTWEFFFTDKAIECITKFNDGHEFAIAGVEIAQDGILLSSPGLIKEHRLFIPWNDVDLKYYNTHFVIHSKSNVRKFNFAYRYLETWNAWLLQIVLSQILKQEQQIKT